MSEQKSIFRRFISTFSTYKRVFVVLITCALVGNIITFVLYNYTQTLLKERLQERLVAIVSTAATQFNPNDIKAVRSIEDVDSEEYARLALQLESIRDANKNLMYVYMMRRTDDPNTLEFVADAEGMIPPEEWDFDGDGDIEEDEMVPMPGDPYDVSPYPELRDYAFAEPVAASELEEDAWSVQLSAYAPIFDEDGEAVSIIGIDVEVTDFKERTQATLLPFILFIFALIFLLTLLTLIIVRFQGERVKMMHELDRQKDELLGIVSHQLATPVSSLKWYLEMMHDGDLGELTGEQHKEVTTMQQTACDLADLVSMILDVSRIQLGRMKVNRAELDLDSFFDEVIAGINIQAQDKKVDFKIERPKKLSTAMLDKRLMRMTLENLLSNAVKYTPSGGEVTISIHKKDGALCYEVKDTGVGIPKSDHEHMFEKLFRASNVRNEVDGNGFGLYVAKGAVEAQSGTISFTSEEGKGTTFRVWIPLDKKQKHRKKPPEKCEDD